ncbi:MAG: hypothetical protein AAGA56_01115 [Myxococcota bacterium]
MRRPTSGEGTNSKAKFAVVAACVAIGLAAGMVMMREKPLSKAAAPSPTPSPPVDSGAAPVDEASPDPSPREERPTQTYTLRSEVVDGRPCWGGDVLVKTTIDPELPHGVFSIGSRRSPTLSMLHLPLRPGGPFTVPVTARVEGREVASTEIALDPVECPARVSVLARSVGMFEARVRVALLGPGLPDDEPPLLRYDFGDEAPTTETASRDVTHDYGDAAEGHSFVIRVTVVEPKFDGRDGDPALESPWGLTVIHFPVLDDQKKLSALIAERQAEQNREAKRRGWNNQPPGAASSQAE